MKIIIILVFQIWIISVFSSDLSYFDNLLNENKSIANNIPEDIPYNPNEDINNHDILNEEIKNNQHIPNEDITNNQDIPNEDITNQDIPKKSCRFNEEKFNDKIHKEVDICCVNCASIRQVSARDLPG